MYRFLYSFSLIMGWFYGSTGVLLAEDDPQAILNKAIKAHGGEAKLTAIKAVKFESGGEITEEGGNAIGGGGISFVSPISFARKTMFLLPGNYRCIETTNSLFGKKQRRFTLFTKDKGISSRGGVMGENLTNLKSEMLRLQITFLPISLRDKVFKLSALSESKVNGKPAQRIKVQTEGNQDIELCFDKATGLLMMTSYQYLDEGKKITVEHELKGHRQVDGVTVPITIEVRRNHKRKVYMEENFTDVELLKTLDKKEFDEETVRKKADDKDQQERN